MSYRVIRVSEDYRVVVVVTPENAKFEDDGAIYYLHKETVEGNSEEFWGEISARGTLAYFSGHADGMGWREMPEGSFESLSDIEKWVTEQEHRYSRDAVRSLFTPETLAGSASSEHLVEYLGEVDDVDSARFFIDLAKKWLPSHPEAAKRVLTTISESVAVTGNSGFAQEVAELLG